MRTIVSMVLAIACAGCGETADVVVPGPRGERGERGFDGVQGLTGIDGAQGPQGDPGPQGPKGGNGADGVDGAQGPEGKPGVSASTSSGSRLRARYLAGEDGARQFLGWNDTTRGEPCQFSTAVDGATRCLPVTMITGATASGPNGLPIFSDPSCALSLIIGSVGKQYATDMLEGAWLGGPASVGNMREIGDPALSGYQVNGETQACEPVAEVPAGLFAQGALIDPAAFVKAVEAVE